MRVNRLKCKQNYFLDSIVCYTKSIDLYLLVLVLFSISNGFLPIVLNMIFFSFSPFSCRFISNQIKLMRCIPEICVRAAIYAEAPTVYFSPEMCARAFAFASLAPFLAAIENTKQQKNSYIII